MSEYVPIIYWVRCNPPIRSVIGQGGLYLETGPVGWFQYDNRTMSPLTGEKLEAERKRRGEKRLTQRELERYP